MKTLYIECNMGAAGDMLTAALLELIPDRHSFTDKMNSIGLAGVHVSASKVLKMGITGTQMTLKINGTEEISEDVHESGDHHHHHGDGHESGSHYHHHGDGHESEGRHHHSHNHSHSSMEDIRRIINNLDVSDKVKTDAEAIYRMIAEAESSVHGITAEEIHFHEVGAMDAVADIVGVCVLMEIIAPDRVVVSPVHTGYGSVRCAHGILPVPAPAAAYILRGVPVYSGAVEGELCTPTGAALVKYFADDFGPLPPMKITGTGYGMGKKDFSRLNCIRVFTGETEEEDNQVIELVCNIDDMTGESLGYAQEILMKNGACDVFTISAGMKKNRPGVLLTCICRKEQRDDMLRLIFKHTTTIGVREHVSDRYILERRTETVSTESGDVRVKYSEGYGVSRCKPEYDDIIRIAEEKNISIEQVMNIIKDRI